MATDDAALELIKARKLLELRKKGLQPKREPSPRDLVVARLVDRGVEVLEAAERQFPKAAAAIVKYLARLIEKGAIMESISGGELLWLFRQLGFNVYVETKIVVQEGDRLLPLGEKLKLDSD